MSVITELSDVFCCLPGDDPKNGPYVPTTSPSMLDVPLELLDNRLRQFLNYINTTDFDEITLVDPRRVLSRQTKFMIKIRYCEQDKATEQILAVNELGFIGTENDGEWDFECLYVHRTTDTFRWPPVHTDFIDTFIDDAYNGRFNEDFRKVLQLKCPVHGREFCCRIHERRRYTEGECINVGYGFRQWCDPTDDMERLAIAAGFAPSEED